VGCEIFRGKEKENEVYIRFGKEKKEDKKD
jgi:hypothetical protein